MYEMRNWSIQVRDPFTAPELQNKCLAGKVYKHKTFPKGASIITSHIIEVEDCDTYKIVKTKNSQYKIYKDQIDTDYENAFPDAYNRLAMMACVEEDV